MSWLSNIFYLFLSLWIRIRIPNTDPDPKHCMESSDNKQWFGSVTFCSGSRMWKICCGSAQGDIFIWIRIQAKTEWILIQTNLDNVLLSCYGGLHLTVQELLEDPPQGGERADVFCPAAVEACTRKKLTVYCKSSERGGGWSRYYTVHIMQLHYYSIRKKNPPAEKNSLQQHNI